MKLERSREMLEFRAMRTFILTSHAFAVLSG